MKKSVLGRKVWCLALAAVMLFAAAGCGSTPGAVPGDGDASGSGQAGDLMLELRREGGAGGGTGVTAADLTGDGPTAVTDFGVRLLQCAISAGKDFSDTAEGGGDAAGSANILISPLSVAAALAMTANGAREETLAQTEQMFGIPVPELSAYLSAYQRALPRGEKYKLSMANSIWFKDDARFTVEQDFLRANEDYFGAGLYKAPFDMTTLKEINDWVNANTDGMIPEILDEIPAMAVMYLLNALVFDAEWQSVYEEYQVRDGEFTTEDGTKRPVELMYSTEYRYLEDESAAGFVKYYDEGKYAFAALLPKEGITLSEYVSSLTGEKLRKILTGPVEVEVHAAIPKFKSEYTVSLNESLRSMGMADAFDPLEADFKGIGTYAEENLYISRVLHKTFIQVDEMGTKAGAATMVEMKATGIAAPSDYKTVYLDRPFVYLIMDCETNLPVFLGVAAEPADWKPAE